MGLKEGGLHGVEFVGSDDHQGLKKAIAECLSGAAWRRCYVDFLRNAIDHLPRKRDEDCLQEPRWLYDRRQLKEAKADIKAWIEKWQVRYSKLVAWVEDNIEETLTYYRLPLAHHRNLKSTNMLKRFNEEIRRRRRLARIFPNEASCLRLVRAFAQVLDVMPVFDLARSPVAPLEIRRIEPVGGERLMRTATCSCGQLSVKCAGEPTSVSQCHCLACQRRTGSTYGIAAFFPRAAANVSGADKTFTRQSDSGYPVVFHFCPECGSNVYWEPRRKPDVFAVAAGAFADPTFPAPTKEVYVEHRHHWVQC